MNAQTLRQELLKDEAVRDQVAHRAFQIFKQTGYVLGRDFENWLQAENEILTPMIEAELAKQTPVEAAPAEATKTTTKKAVAKKAEAPKVEAPKVEEKTAEPVEVKVAEPAKKTTTKSAAKTKTKGGKNAESTK